MRVLRSLFELAARILCHPYTPRFVVLIVLIAALGRPPRPVVRLGDRQVVYTVNPKMGVHTRLTDEVEEWKIKRTLEMVREMGARWIVEYFPWGYYEPEKGHYDWSHPDLVIQHATRQGLTVMARIDFVPVWARPAETTFRYLAEDSYQHYADFVRAFVHRYSGQVRYLIVWNEPNLSFEWGYRPPDPDSYTRLLQAAYTAAKQADPSIMVLVAGMAPTLAPAGSELAMNDLEYLKGMYDSGAQGYFDGVAIHAYGWVFPPDDAAASEAVNYARAELVHQVMAEHGDGDLPCFITEAGWNDHRRWTKAVSPALRVQYTLRAYQKALDEWPWCPMVAMWAFRYPWPAHSYADGFTFVDPSFTVKQIYGEVQRYARGGSAIP
jgi:polysaccharide biosynthesis protein PslG